MGCRPWHRPENPSVQHTSKAGERAAPRDLIRTILTSPADDTDNHAESEQRMRALA